MTPPKASGLTPIYLASLVCSMGMMGFVALAGPLAATLGLNAAQIGLSAMAGGLGWVLAARAWGRAADRLGRRAVLLAGVTGFAIFYLALCLVVQAGSAWGLAAHWVLAGLIAARLAMGLTYSAVPAAANALIADRFVPEARVGAMGRLGAAQAAGLLLGPAFVALTAGPSPVLPLFLLALLPLPVLAVLALRLPADRPDGAGTAVPALPLTDARLRGPVFAALALMTAVGIAQIVVGSLALDRLGLPSVAATRLAGGALAAVGVALIVAQVVVGRLGWAPSRLHPCRERVRRRSPRLVGHDARCRLRAGWLRRGLDLPGDLGCGRERRGACGTGPSGRSGFHRTRAGRHAGAGPGWCGLWVRRCLAAPAGRRDDRCGRLDELAQACGDGPR